MHNWWARPENWTMGESIVVPTHQARHILYIDENRLNTLKTQSMPPLRGPKIEMAKLLKRRFRAKKVPEGLKDWV
jgi:hypothetical protein